MGILRDFFHVHRIHCDDPHPGTNGETTTSQPRRTAFRAVLVPPSYSRVTRSGWRAGPVSSPVAISPASPDGRAIHARPIDREPVDSRRGPGRGFECRTHLDGLGPR